MSCAGCWRLCWLLWQRLSPALLVAGSSNCSLLREREKNEARRKLREEGVMRSGAGGGYRSCFEEGYAKWNIFPYIVHSGQRQTAAAPGGVGSAFES